NGVEVQVQHREGEFAADDDDWPADANPSTIARRLRDQSRGEPALFERLMADRIEHRHNLSLDVDGVRYIHVAAERAAEALCEHGLSISRRAEEKDPLRCIGGRSKLIEQAVGHDEMREAPLEPL